MKKFTGYFEIKKILWKIFSNFSLQVTFLMFIENRYSLSFSFCYKREKKKEKTKTKTKGDYFLTNATPHAWARSRLDKSIGGLDIFTNGDLDHASILARTSAHAFLSRRACSTTTCQSVAINWGTLWISLAKWHSNNVSMHGQHVMVRWNIDKFNIERNVCIQVFSNARENLLPL